MILLDTHVVVWMRADPERLAPGARTVIETADDLAISAITLWELAMLVDHGRLAISDPVRVYLRAVSAASLVLPITADVAATVVELPESFPTRDPADRLIYATAQVHEVPLVSSDGELRRFDDAVIWN